MKSYRYYQKKKRKEKRILMSERKRDFNITFKGLAYVAATFLKLLYISRLLCLVILLISAY